MWREDDLRKNPKDDFRKIFLRKRNFAEAQCLAPKKLITQDLK